MEIAVATETHTAAGIEILSEIPWDKLNLYKRIWHPCIEVDGGQPMILQWGASFVPVGPGPHRLKLYVKAPISGLAAQTETVTSGSGRVKLHFVVPLMGGRPVVTQSDSTALPADAASAPRACPQCGGVLKDGMAFCPQCGHHLQPPAPAVSHICPQCSGPVKEGMQFCPKCGVRLEPAPTAFTHVCPECDGPAEPGSTACPACDHPIYGGVAA